MEFHPNGVMAFHITWTTYGTWLHGDARGWIESGTDGIQEPDYERLEQSRQKLKDSIVFLDTQQRAVVVETIKSHCHIRIWELHALHVGVNHIHVVVSADNHPEVVMDQLKAWCSRKLSDAAGLTAKIAKKAGRRKWFTEHGSTKWIFDQRYFNEAISYVNERQ